MWVVALNELPPTRETVALRLLGTGSTRMEALREIGGMSADDPERPVLLALVGVDTICGERESQGGGETEQGA